MFHLFVLHTYHNIKRVHGLGHIHTVFEGLAHLLLLQEVVGPNIGSATSSHNWYHSCHACRRLDNTVTRTTIDFLYIP